MTRLRLALDRHWYAYAMVAPVVLVLALLVLYPLGRGLWFSLTNANESNLGRTIGPNHIPSTYEFVGLDNYTRILSGAEGHFYPVLLWTVVWTLVCVALHYGIGLALALLLNPAYLARLSAQRTGLWKATPPAPTSDPVTEFAV